MTLVNKVGKDINTAISNFNRVSPIPLNLVSLQGEFAQVQYGPVAFWLHIPTVHTKEEEFPVTAQVVLTGLARKSPIHGNIRTRRICRVMLANSGVDELQAGYTPEEAMFAISQGTWYLMGFWELYFMALLKAQAVCAASSVPNPERTQSIFNREVSRLLGSLEFIKSDAHLASQGRCIELAYPGRDCSQGIIKSDLGPEVVNVVRDAFLEKAAEIGCCLPITSKSHPGRKVAYAPLGHSPAQTMIGIWSNFDCVQRTRRELFTAVSNAEKYKNNSNTIPLVTNDLGTPKYLDGRIKFLNCGVFSFDSIVPKIDGKHLNVDQILASGWSQLDNTMDVISEIVEEFELIPSDISVDESGKTKYDEEAAVARWKKENRYTGEGVLASISIRPDGPLFEMHWLISRPVDETSEMVYKISNADAIKGMVVPSKELYVEKRDGEDFYRPIYFFFANEAVIKKNAERAVLRMIYSQLPEEDRTKVEHNVPREDYQKLMGSAISKLGRSPYSRLYRIIPGDSEIKVLGFTQVTKDNIIAIDGVGSISGVLDPVLCNGEVATLVCGEQPILRLPEDEEFGKQVRLKETNNGVSLDPFLVLGKEGLTLVTDPEVSAAINGSVELYHLLKEN